VTSLGNRYLAVGGINPSGSHVDETAALALKLHQVAREVGRERDVALSLQIGLDVGPVVAGLIGQRRLRFDIWGETVSRAGSLQHRASAGQTLCSSNIRDRLSKPELCRYIDMLHAAGNQPMRVYHLEPPKSRVVQAEPSFDIASS
jgi:class 3 adenylate cyclase